jgi:hypothetical protein
MKIINENKINLILAFKLNLSSRNPMKKKIVENIKNIIKSALLKPGDIVFK